MKKIHITLISPNIVSQKGDVAGTGIPYVPISLVYLATYLRSKGYPITFIDSFSENPFKVTEGKGKDTFLYQGITPDDIASRVHPDTGLIVLYAAQVYAHESLMQIVEAVKKFDRPILIVENTQAVTSYSLQHSYKEFFEHGIKYLLAGESEPRIEDFISMLEGKSKPENVDGLIYKDAHGKVRINPKKKLQNPDLLPFPDWSLLRMDNYWKLGYAHAPLTTGKYLPLLTSRGCPLICAFCVVPSTNWKRWRPRSAKNVVDEIEFNHHKYRVREFHIEDLNPTVDRNRIIDICKLLLERRLRVMLKFAAGTKAETFDLETIDWMARAGFNYVSISPESGSPRVLDLMHKYFNHAEALRQVRKMYKLRITSQACIVLGFPGETEADLKLTRKYVNKLARAGLDEVALFIMTPVPGSYSYDKIEHKPDKISQFTFTPKWRHGYKNILRWRVKILISFMFFKILFHPFKTFGSLVNFLTRKFRTKTEMTVYRIIKTHFLFNK